MSDINMLMKDKARGGGQAAPSSGEITPLFGGICLCEGAQYEPKAHFYPLEAQTSREQVLKLFKVVPKIRDPHPPEESQQFLQTKIRERVKSR